MGTQRQHWTTVFQVNVDAVVIKKTSEFCQSRKTVHACYGLVTRLIDSILKCSIFVEFPGTISNNCNSANRLKARPRQALENRSIVDDSINIDEQPPRKTNVLLPYSI